MASLIHCVYTHATRIQTIKSLKMIGDSLTHLPPLTNSATAAILPKTQCTMYSQNHLTNTGLNLILQMTLFSSREGGLNYLTLTDLAYFCSTCKGIKINSRSIWKNLLVHYNHGFDHGFLKKSALNQINPETYKVIFLQLTRLQISFKTPHLVFKAAERGCKELMDLLVKNENKIYTQIADIFVRKQAMPHPTQHEAFVHALKKDIDTFKKRDKKEHWTPLHHATLAGDTDLVRALCAHHVFCKESNKKIGKTLHIESRNNEGYTPLMYAAMHGHLEIARMLLKAGAIVDETDNFQSTPLLEASIAGHVETVSLLLEHRADPEKADTFGKTPLMHAAEEGQLAIFNLLIENNANINTKDPIGRTADFYATYPSNKLAAQYSQTPESDPNKTNIYKAMIKQEKIINTLRQALEDFKKQEEQASCYKRRKL